MTQPALGRGGNLMCKMNISQYNKAEVLAALYNASKVQGMGFLQAIPNHVMTTEEAQTLLDGDGTYLKGRSFYFDYLHGKVMKVDLAKDELDTRLYNRDNGEGAAEAAIAAIKTVNA